MKRYISKLKFVLPVAALLTTTAFVATPAMAWEQSWTSKDGSVSLWYERGSDGQTKFAVVIEKDGKFGVYFEKGVIDAVFDKIGSSNPDPSDPNNGQGTFKPDIAELLKDAKGVHVNVTPEIWDTPLGDYISRGGNGKGPKWNPGPDDDGSPSSGPGSVKKPEGPTPQEIAAKMAAINALARSHQNMKGGMYDGSEGGTEGPPSVGPKSGGGSSGQGGGSGDDKGPDKPNIDTDELGPKPEVVNPPYFKTPATRHAKSGADTKKVKTVKVDTKGKVAKAGGNSALMGPGLLDGGPSLGASGPAGAGSPMGSGGMSAAAARGVAARAR